MACCCGTTSGGASALPILTGAGQPVTPPDPTTHLPLYRDVTTGHLWLWSGGAWSITRAPIDWMIGSLASTPLQGTDFITINRGGTPGNPDGGTYYVSTIQDLAAAIGSIVGATVVQSGDTAIGVSAAGNVYTVTFEPQGGASEIAGDATALATLFGAASIQMLSDVATVAPALNDALVWNGAMWAPVPLSTLTSDSFVNGGSVTGGGTTLTLTYNTPSLPPVNINVATIVPNYDNTTSGLTSTNMQAAIDELAAMFGGAFTNIGTGQPVYAGFNAGNHELHSIDGANGISASIQGSTIVLQFDPASLTPVAIQQLASMIAGDTTAITTIAGAINLGDLADVNTAGAANGEVLTYQGGTWVPAPPPAGGSAPVEEVLQGICAECFDDALAQGLQPGDYFLHVGTNPPTLFQYDGTNLNGVSPYPDIFVCCNTNDVWVTCNGQFVGAMAVGDELAHMTMNVFCAATEADALALGLQAHQYWLDTSVTPPVLMHYNGSTSTPATFTPRVVNCCNTGEVFIRCQSGAATGDLVPLGGGAGGPVVPKALGAICAVDEATAITDGLVAGGYWLDTSAVPPVVMHYDGTTSTPASPQPDLVICTNTGALYVDDGSDTLVQRSISAANVTVQACPSGPINADMDLQTAICTLSSAASPPLPFFGPPVAQALVRKLNTIAYNYVLDRQNGVNSVTTTTYGRRWIVLNLANPITVLNLSNEPGAAGSRINLVMFNGVAAVLRSTSTFVGTGDATMTQEFGVVAAAGNTATTPALTTATSVRVSYSDKFSGYDFATSEPPAVITYLAINLYDAVL